MYSVPSMSTCEKKYMCPYSILDNVYNTEYKNINTMFYKYIRQ